MITVHIHDPQERRSYSVTSSEVLCDLTTCQVQEAPAPTPLQVPQYGPEWVAFAMAGGTITNGNILHVPAEESIND